VGQLWTLELKTTTAKQIRLLITKAFLPIEGIMLGTNDLSHDVFLSFNG
jgi:hypothetical protein